MISSSIFILADFFSEISRSSKNHGGKNYYIILSTVFAAITILWLVLYVLDKYKKTETQIKKKPKVPLFLQLCRAHSLTSEQSNLLKTMTTRSGLQPAEVIFVDPTLWSHCIKDSIHNQEQLREIMAKLFGAERVEQWFDSQPEAISPSAQNQPEPA